MKKRDMPILSLLPIVEYGATISDFDFYKTTKKPKKYILDFSLHLCYLITLEIQGHGDNYGYNLLDH
jgi:hypothetical protein